MKVGVAYHKNAGDSQMVWYEQFNFESVGRQQALLKHIPTMEHPFFYCKFTKNYCSLVQT